MEELINHVLHVTQILYCHSDASKPVKSLLKWQRYGAALLLLLQSLDTPKSVKTIISSEKLR